MSETNLGNVNIFTSREKYIENSASLGDSDMTFVPADIADLGGVKTINGASADGNGNIELFGYGTEDLVAGESALKSGTLYFVYEE